MFFDFSYLVSDFVFHFVGFVLMLICQVESPINAAVADPANPIGLDLMSPCLVGLDVAMIGSVDPEADNGDDPRRGSGIEAAFNMFVGVFFFFSVVFC